MGTDSLCLPEGTVSYSERAAVEGEDALGSPEGEGALGYGSPCRWWQGITKRNDSQPSSQPASLRDDQTVKYGTTVVGGRESKCSVSSNTNYQLPWPILLYFLEPISVSLEFCRYTLCRSHDPVSFLKAASFHVCTW